MMQLYLDPIHFTYKLTDGVIEKSHALAVAKMAGMPADIINRADQILKTKD